MGDYSRAIAAHTCFIAFYRIGAAQSILGFKRYASVPTFLPAVILCIPALRACSHFAADWLLRFGISFDKGPSFTGHGIG